MRMKRKRCDIKEEAVLINSLTESSLDKNPTEKTVILIEHM